MPQQLDGQHGYGRRYFSRSPWSSYHFWVSTFFLLLVASIGLYFAMRFSERLNAEATMTIFFPTVVMTVLWFRVWKAHRDVYTAFCESSSGPRDRAADGEDLRVNVLFDNLAYMSYAGFALALFAVGSAYLAIGQGIAAVTNR